MKKIKNLLKNLLYPGFDPLVFADDRTGEGSGDPFPSAGWAGGKLGATPDGVS